MKPVSIPALNEEQRQALDEVYRRAKQPRVRTRAQMILLAAEKGMKAEEIAEIVRESHATVLRWMHRYLAEGVEGLQDAPRPGKPAIVTAEYREQVVEAVRQRPRSLDLPFSMWTLQRLADYMAERTGIRLSDDTVRRILLKAGIVLSRPQHAITSPDPEYVVKKRRLKKPETA